MTYCSQARAKAILELLDRYIPNPVPSLKFTNNYTMLVAVLLSAQCTDERVNKVTKTLFSIADSAEAMLRLSPDELMEHIRSCGFYRVKAKHILELSRILVDKHGGEVPRSFEELEALPGVGHKTASVVMSHCFSQPAFAVDTHIFRSARRWGLSKGSTIAAVERDLKKVYPMELWGRIHLQIVLYARQFCPAVRHIVAKCPICSMLEGSGERFRKR